MASVNGERTSAFNTRQKGVLALPPDALLRVARCSAHAACAPNMMLKRHDSLDVVLSKGGYDTVKIDVTQTPRPTRPTTAIPVRAEEVAPRSTRWRGSRSGPLRGNSNGYAHPYNRHCIRREPVALSAGRGCDSNFTLSLTLTLYCRLQIGFERYTLPGPTRSQGTRWLIADRLCAHLLRRNEPSPQVCHHAASSLVFPGPPKTINRRR